jgi:hypothetical protein
LLTVTYSFALHAVSLVSSRGSSASEKRNHPMLAPLLLLLAPSFGVVEESAAHDAVPREVLRHRVGIAFAIGAAQDGLLVSRVEPGEPGAEAGLLEGDVLLDVGGVDASTITSENLAEHFSRSDSIAVQGRRGEERFSVTLSPRPTPLAEQEVVGVILDGSHDVPVFEAVLAGQPLHFVLHTGTQQSSLTPEAFERLGQPVPPEGKAVHVGPLRVGHLEFTGRLFSVDAHALPGIEYDGILALPDLAPFLVRLDYANDFLVVESGSLPEADGSEVLDYFVCKDTGPAISVDVAGWQLDMHLDSSFPSGVAVSSEYIGQLPTSGDPAVMGRVRVESEMHDLLGAELAGNVRMGRYELESPGVRFSDGFEHANLGPDALAEFELTFDSENKRVRFQHRSSFLEKLLADAAVTPSLDSGGETLRAAFERGQGKPRLLMLLSPT